MVFTSQESESQRCRSHPIQKIRGGGTSRQVGKAVTIAPLSTSRHRRFKDQIGKGKGCSGPHVVGQRVKLSGKTNQDNTKPLPETIQTLPNKKLQRVRAGKAPMKRDRAQPPICQKQVGLSGQGPFEGPSEISGLYTKNKRKGRDGPGESSKRLTLKEGSRREEKKAELCFNAEGFVEVKVQYGHCVNIADGCGINPKEVLLMVEEDNTERVNMQLVQDMTNTDTQTYEDANEEIDSSRFEPDPEDELSSDME